MKISEDTIREFKELLQEDYPQTEFSDEELLCMATNILSAVRSIYREVPEDRIKNFMKGADLI